MTHTQLGELLLKVIELILQRLDESPVCPVRDSLVLGLRLLQLYESLVVLLLVQPGGILGLEDGLLGFKQLVVYSYCYCSL